ncbi:MAG: GIY-YIG nuclease family protein [Ignisphaera sp.]|nr:GIY-YIG nuclease family protein [Ignisphaera sp.]
MAFKSGIYIITNTLNNKVYIGQSTNIKSVLKAKKSL